LLVVIKSGRLQRAGYVGLTVIGETGIVLVYGILVRKHLRKQLLRSSSRKDGRIIMIS
jgi:hypothetical protein